MADNINISPEIINNFVNMLKNSNNTSDSNLNCNNTENHTEFSNLENILSNFSTVQNNHTNNCSDNNDTNSIDIETLLKIKSIIETLNTKNDPRSNLLNSLKPYLRKSKRSKLDQYANLLKITQVTELLKNDKEN